MSGGAKLDLHDRSERNVCVMQTRPLKGRMPAQSPRTPFSTQFAIVFNSVMFCFSLLLLCFVFSTGPNRQFILGM